MGDAHRVFLPGDTMRLGLSNNVAAETPHWQRSGSQRIYTAQERRTP